MAALKFTRRLDITSVRRALGQVAASLQDCSTPLERSAKEMRESLATNFHQEGRPDNWEPLKDITLAVRTNFGSTEILQDTGALFRSVTTPSAAGSINELTQAYAKIGTNLVYAAFQQQGGTVVPKRAKVLARKVSQDAASRAASMDWPVSNWNGAWYVIFGMSRTIPARPYMVVQDEDLVTFGRVFQGWIQEVFAGVS